MQDRLAEVNQLPAFAFFWGSRDRIIPVRHGERACTLLANSSLNVLPLGHFPHWSAPGLLASALMNQLRLTRCGARRAQRVANLASCDVVARNAR